MEAGRTGLRQVTSEPAIIDRVPRWSPDGNWIAYFSNNRSVLFLVNSWSQDGERIVTYSLRSGTFDRLTEFGEFPVWLRRQPACVVRLRWKGLLRARHQIKRSPEGFLGQARRHRSAPIVARWSGGELLATSDRSQHQGAHARQREHRQVMHKLGFERESLTGWSRSKSCIRPWHSRLG
jgi:hypothetical protein